MGCTTCKEKNQRRNSGKNKPDNVIDLVPPELFSEDYTGNFMFRVVTFVVITAAIPFIILIMVGKIFLTFFMPKLEGGVAKLFGTIWGSAWRKFATIRYKKEILRRKSQFENNEGYEEGSELIDIEDYTEINVHEKNNEKE